MVEATRAPKLEGDITHRWGTREAATHPPVPVPKGNQESGCFHVYVRGRHCQNRPGAGQLQPCWITSTTTPSSKFRRPTASGPRLLELPKSSQDKPLTGNYYIVSTSPEAADTRRKRGGGGLIAVLYVLVNRCRVGLWRTLSSFSLLSISLLFFLTAADFKTTGGKAEG